MTIGSYLNQPVQYKSRTGFDKYGKPVTASAVTIRVRIQGSTKRLVDVNGKEYNADAEMWALPTQSLKLDDIITWEGNNYKVSKIDTKVWVTGTKNHKKAFLVMVRE